MTTTIVTKRAHLTDQFRERLDRKMAKLSKFFDEDANAKVVVSTVRDKEIVEVTVTSKGLLFRSEETAEDMVDSLEAVMDSLTRQILRNRKKLQDRVKKTPVELESSDPVEEEEEFQLVRTKTFPVRFMSAEEAILQMNLLGHTFFLFRNEVTREINVVYRRNDGSYGVLEPES